MKILLDTNILIQRENNTIVPSHYDGIVNRNVSSTEACRGEKSYIQKLGKKIQLYQLNPMCNWLKYKDIGLLKG